MSSTLSNSLETNVPDRSERLRWGPLLDLAVILAVVTVGLYAGHRIDGGTKIGGLVGWASMMLGTALAFLSVRRRGDGLGALGLSRPKSWIRTVALGALVTAVVLVSANALMLYVIIPLVGSPPDVSRFLEMLSSWNMLLIALVSVWTAAAFGEEIIMRGLFLSRVAKVLGGSLAAWYGALVISSVLFGLMHFYQGLTGVLITGLIGFLLGLAYLLPGRNLWIVILAHGLIDTISLTMLYLSIHGSSGS